MRMNRNFKKFGSKIAAIAMLVVFTSCLNDCQGDVVTLNPVVPADMFTPIYSRSISAAADAMNDSNLMIGFVAFIPNGEGTVRWYIGKQRPFGHGYVGPNNNPGAGNVIANVFNTTTDSAGRPVDGRGMHTERQLIIRALQNAVGRGGNPTNASGILYVYTKRPPCCEWRKANCYFGCHQYYNVLAQACPNVIFHVYSSVSRPGGAGLRKDVFNTVATADLAHIVNLIRNKYCVTYRRPLPGPALPHVGTFSVNSYRQLVMSNGNILQTPAGAGTVQVRSVTGDMILGNLEATSSLADRNTFINDLNTTIAIGRRGIAREAPVLTDAEVENIISTLYKINGAPLPANLHYHVTN